MAMRLAVLLAFVPATRAGFGDGPHHWREPATAANPNVPRWATTYDWEMTPDTGALRRSPYAPLLLLRGSAL